MAHNRIRFAFLATAAAALGTVSAPAAAQLRSVSVSDEVHAGELAVPVNKSQVLRADRPYVKAMIGNPEIADVLPLSNQSLYVLGKKAGTTSLTLYDRANTLIAVVDVVVGPDVTSLKRQLSELMPSDKIGARMSNDSVVLEGIVSSGPAADRAVQLAETYAPGKVVNMLSIGAAQQVMLEVRFSEVKRSALKQIGVSGFLGGGGDNGFAGAIGGGASLTPNPTSGAPVLGLGSITDTFGVVSRMFKIFGGTVDATLDALERKGVITTLAEPTLVALSGETASFLAGGEFPVPVIQNSSGSGGNNNGTFTVEWKPFGVSLAFTPTVLADGVINMIVAPEVSSIDPSASIVINNLRIPGLQTRRAKTVVEVRDGESFAMAGLLRRDFQDTVRQFPVLGSLPIIGSLFRSTGFQREETELVIIVTPRLVRPVRADAFKVPTDRVRAPNEADLFLNGKTHQVVPTAPTSGLRPPLPHASSVGAAPTSTGPVGLEKDYGHAL